MYGNKRLIHDNSSGPAACDCRARVRTYAAWRWVLAWVLAGMFFGCAMTDDYTPPPADMEPGWRIDYQAAAELANTAWWEAFQDPVLNRLIETALNENLDLRIAAARVEEAAARVQATKSELYPQLGYGGSGSRRRASEEVREPFGEVRDRTNTIWQGFLSASWELDIWGRIRRSTDAARADLLATEEARQAIILTLVSAVARSYLELLSLDKQLQIAQETVAFRNEWLQLFEKKKRAGLISELELIQVRQSSERAMTRIPVLEMQIAMQENALSVLLGRNPGPIERDKTLDTVVMPGIPQGIPSDLLAWRPDIRRIEQNLIAANARIDVARTLYFPTISLTGLFGYASSDMSDLFQDSANFWNAGGGFLGPIFTGGLIKSEIKQAEARYTQLLNDYLLSIQTAFKEVNDALVSWQKLDELLPGKGKLVSTLEGYNDFSRKSYDSGFTSYLTVLDAEEKLFVEEIGYARTQSDLLVALVSIYKAMGGGWVTEADKQIVHPLSRPNLKR